MAGPGNSSATISVPLRNKRGARRPCDRPSRTAYGPAIKRWRAAPAQGMVCAALEPRQIAHRAAPAPRSRLCGLSKQSIQKTRANRTAPSSPDWLQRKAQTTLFGKKPTGDNNAKDNFGRAQWRTSYCINRASDAGFRTPPHPDDEPCGSEREVSQQSSLYRTGYCSAVGVVGLRRRAGIRDGWSLISDSRERLRHGRSLSEAARGVRKMTRNGKFHCQ